MIPVRSFQFMHGAWHSHKHVPADLKLSCPCNAPLLYTIPTPLPAQIALSFTSNWTPVGGVDEYARLAGVDHNGFFTDAGAQAQYKQYVATILGRTNTINGRACESSEGGGIPTCPGRRTLPD